MKKKIIALIVLAVLIAAIFAVQHFNTSKKDTSVKEPATTGKGSATTTDENEETPLIFGFSCADMSDPYYAALEASLRYEAEENEAELITKDANGDQEIQNRDLKEFADTPVNVIFLVPVTPDGVDDTLRQIDTSQIPVICLDSRIADDSLISCFIGSDNQTAGRLCGKDLVKRVPKGGTLLILEDYSSSAVSDSISGFEHAVAGKGFSVSDRSDCGGSRETAHQYMTEALQANHDITAIMCGNDLMALGVADALAEYNRDSAEGDMIYPLVYGVGGYPELKEKLMEDQSMITATAATSPLQVGQDAGVTALSLLNKDKVEEEILKRPYLINRRNISLYGIDGWQ